MLREVYERKSNAMIRSAFGKSQSSPVERVRLPTADGASTGKELCNKKEVESGLKEGIAKRYTKGHATSPFSRGQLLEDVSFQGEGSKS